MKSLPLLFAVAIFFLMLFAVLIRKLRSQPVASNEPWPYYVKKPLSEPEQVRYHRLVHALPGHIVLAQVQVSRILGVKRGKPVNEWNNRINRMSYDFVVCAKDATVLVAIELDDRSHDVAARKTTDAKKDKATADAGLKLIRWTVGALPTEGEIRSMVSPSPVSTPTVQPAAVSRRRT